MTVHSSSDTGLANMRCMARTAWHMLESDLIITSTYDLYWSIYIYICGGGSLNIRSTVLEVPIIRTIIFGGPYSGPLFWETTMYVYTHL